MKILVADDDPVSLRMMERTLQKSGYEVITVDNGRQAAEELTKAGGPRLADAVHGAAAAAVGTTVAAAGGGALVIVGVLIAALMVPAFVRYRV